MMLNDKSTPPEISQAINDVLIPYGISANIFVINAYCIENCCEQTPEGMRATKSVIATVQDLRYKFSCIRNSRMPMWYYYAFPDVFLWSLSDASELFYRDFENKYGKDNFMNEFGEVATKYVKLFIEAYIKSTHNKLECAL